MVDRRTYEDRKEYMRVYLAEYRRRRKAAEPGWDPAYGHRRSPEQHRAGESVRYAIKTGRLTRPETCENCGDGGPIEAAHHDYSKRLDVRWLCRPCHRKWDHAEPKGGSVKSKPW